MGSQQGKGFATEVAPTNDIFRSSPIAGRTLNINNARDAAFPFHLPERGFFVSSFNPRSQEARRIFFGKINDHLVGGMIRASTPLRKIAYEVIVRPDLCDALPGKTKGAYQGIHLLLG